MKLTTVFDRIKPQLFLMHYAGGNRYSFRKIIQLLPDFDVFPLELPGRAKRANESLLSDFDSATMDIYRQIDQQLNASQFFLFGHSMGAYLALKITAMLERSGRFPSHLFVGGNPGPGITEKRKRYAMPHDDFVQELRNLGGVPEEIFLNKELFEFFEPILRSDFKIAEEHGLENLPPVKTPILAMMGEEEADVDKIQNWKKFTISDFSFKVMRGGHFFVHQDSTTIAHVINSFSNQEHTKKSAHSELS